VPGAFEERDRERGRRGGRRGRGREHEPAQRDQEPSHRPSIIRAGCGGAEPGGGAQTGPNPGRGAVGGAGRRNAERESSIWRIAASRSLVRNGLERRGRPEVFTAAVT